MRPLFRLSDNGGNAVATRNPAANIQVNPKNVALDTFNKISNDQNITELNAIKLAMSQQNRSDDRQTKALEAMIKDPQNAASYARAYGIQITPDIQDMLNNPREAQLMIDGLKMAKMAGIDKYDAMKQFTAAYMQSGGDPLSAMESVKGYTSTREDYIQLQRDKAMRREPQANTGGRGVHSFGGTDYKVGNLPTGTRLNLKTGQIEYIPGTSPEMLKKQPQSSMLTGIEEDANVVQPNANPALTPEQLKAAVNYHLGSQSPHFNEMQPTPAPSPINLEDDLYGVRD